VFSRAENPSKNRRAAFRRRIGPGVVLRPKATITPHCERFEASLVESTDEMPVIAVAMPID
jgi:hypothetical protein